MFNWSCPCDKEWLCAYWFIRCYHYYGGINVAWINLPWIKRSTLIYGGSYKYDRLTDVAELCICLHWVLLNLHTGTKCSAIIIFMNIWLQHGRCVQFRWKKKHTIKIHPCWIVYFNYYGYTSSDVCGCVFVLPLKIKFEEVKTRTCSYSW